MVLVVHPQDNMWSRRKQELAARTRSALKGRFKPLRHVYYVRAHSHHGRTTNRLMRYDWCTKNCRGLWFIRLKIHFEHGHPGATLYTYSFAFFDDVDAVMFKMQWPDEWN